MPRDDLSIDFVRKMPPVESLDPALILDEWINRTSNLPEEIRFLQNEIADKDRQYDKLIREIEDRDGRIQKFIKTHGSHQNMPKEDEYRALVRSNFAQAEQLSNEKIALTQKLQTTMDKHIRQLDAQIKMLYDRAEPGFTDPDELPSLIRPSAANITNSNPAARPVNTLPVPVPSALNPVINNASQSAIRAANAQIRSTQAAQHHGSASAPATPAASMLMHSRQVRESSAGPPKRGNSRSNSGLSNFPTTSSGLARHNSLGPGTPKAHYTTTAINTQRAGSAGPTRTSTSKITGTGASNRKAGTPSSTAGGASRSKKGGTPANAGGGGSNKSGLSRVKRAAKNSPSSTVDSELSDAESGSGDDSDAHQPHHHHHRAQSNGGNSSFSHHRSSSNQTLPHSNNHNSSGHHDLNGSGPNNGGPGGGGSNGFHHGGGAGGVGGGVGSGGGGGGGGPNGSMGHPHGPPPGSSHGRPRDQDYNDDAMDVDDDDAGDDKKYCSCQNVSFGNMVACDNEDCPYEWFHWGCVGLKSEPNGTWYCPDCSETMRKKARTGS